MSKWEGAIPSRSEQKAQKINAILRVAARTFNRKGFSNTSLDEIASELGVSKPALYHYFKSKDELLYNCIEKTYSLGRRARLESEAFEGSSVEKLRVLFYRFILLLTSEQGAYISASDFSSLQSEHQVMLQEGRRKFDAYSRSLFKSAIEEGSIRDIDPLLVSNFYLGSVNWILRWYREGGSATPEEIANLFLDLMFNGISTQRDSDSLNNRA